MLQTQLERLVDDICARCSSVPGDPETVVAGLVDERLPLLEHTERRSIIARAVARLDGLDALDEHLADPSVDEVMVNRGRDIWIDRAGTTRLVAHLPDGAIDVVLERILAPLGKRLDRTTPIVDARLPSGARLCAVVAPVALDGTVVSVRRHRRRTIGLDQFADVAVQESIAELVRRRANVLITGATTAGKTSLLASMAALTDPAERLVVIEDTSEITIHDRHAVRLEARGAGVDGQREITLDELVRTALRLRPDRLIIGEFRGREVLAVVQALNTGHDGSLSTCHANGAIDGLRRVETLVMQAAPSWPLPAIRAQVSRSFDAIVHVERRADGFRRVHEVVEVIESAGEPNGKPIVNDGRVVDRFTRGRA